MFSVTRAPSYSVVSYFSPLNSKCLTSWNFHFALVLTMYFVFSILICCPSCLEPSPIIWSIFLLNALGFLPIWPTSSVTTITWRELVYIAGEIFRMTCSRQRFKSIVVNASSFLRPFRNIFTGQLRLDLHSSACSTQRHAHKPDDQMHLHFFHHHLS